MDWSKLLQSTAKSALNTATGGIVGGATSFISDLLFGNRQRNQAKELAQFNADLQNRYAMAQMSENNRLLRDNMRDQAFLNIQGMKMAGLNPASQNMIEASGSAPSSQGALSGDVSSALSSINQASLNSALLGSQSRLQNAQAKQLEIQNDREDEFDYILANGPRQKSTYLDPDGNVIKNLDKWVKEHPSETPELVVTRKFKNKGALEAFLKQLELSAQEPEVLARKWKANLDKLVTKQQFNDDEVVHALVKLPQEQLKELTSIISNNGSMVTLHNNQATLAAKNVEVMAEQIKQMQNSNLAQIIDGFHSDMTFGQFVAQAFKLFFTFASSVLGFSHKF